MLYVRPTRKHCFLAVFFKGGHTRKHCFLAMFAKDGHTRKHCFLAVFFKGGPYQETMKAWSFFSKVNQTFLLPGSEFCFCITVWGTGIV
jgi:hypothetical protein